MPTATHRTSRRPFVLLEMATLLSGAGNGIALVVLPWLVLERTGSAGAAGLLAAATAVPLLLASLFSGTIVDRIGRRRTAIGSDVLSCASVALIPLVDRAADLNLGLLIALAVIGAVFDPAGVTARETMLPAAAGEAGWPLHKVNGIHEAVWGSAFIIGPGLGGVLIAWVGTVDALWITAVAFALSAAMVALLRVPNDARPSDDEEPLGIWQGTVEGLRFVRRDPLLLVITLISAAVIAVYMPIEAVLLPVYFEALDEPGRLGIIVMAMSIGGIASALAYSAFADRVSRVLIFRESLLVTASCVFVLSFRPTFPVMVAAAFAVGLGYGPLGPLINLAMQARSSEAMRGRVVGIITSTEYAAGPLGYLAVGAATARFGVGPTFITVAVLLLVVCASSLGLHSLRELDDLVLPTDPPSGASEVIDAATRGPLPLVRPVRDPDHPKIAP